MAKYIGGSLGLEHFGPIHFYSLLTLAVFFAYFLLSTLISFVFWSISMSHQRPCSKKHVQNWFAVDIQFWLFLKQKTNTFQQNANKRLFLF